MNRQKLGEVESFADSEGYLIRGYFEDWWEVTAMIAESEVFQEGHGAEILYDLFFYDVPFVDRLGELDAEFANVVKAVKAGDVEQIRSAFEAFGKSYERVDGKALTGHVKLIWKELVML